MARWECEVQPTDADQTGVQYVALEGVYGIPLDQDAVISGEMFAEDAVLTDGKLVIPKKSKKALVKIDKRGPAASSKTSEPGAWGWSKVGSFQSCRTHGPCVRVQVNGGVTTASQAPLSGDIFGTGKAKFGD